MTKKHEDHPTALEPDPLNEKTPGDTQASERERSRGSFGQPQGDVSPGRKPAYSDPDAAQNDRANPDAPKDQKPTNIPEKNEDFKGNVV